MSTKTYFNGEILTIPGAYSAIDTSQMSTSDSSAASKVIALLGESTGGEPGAVQFFTEPVSAKKVLKGGDLLKAAQKAWKPTTGANGGGASTIACIRTNRATSSVLDIIPNDRTFKSSTLAEVPSDKTVLLGKTVSTFIRNGNVLDDGSVMGSLKWVEDFTAFNESVKAEQNGYFFPVKLTGKVTGKTMSIVKNGEERDDKKDMPFDPELILRVEDSNDRFAVYVDGKHVITFNFKKTSFNDEEADIWPQIRFESKDWGADTAHQIKIANGTLNGTKKITIFDQTSGTYEQFDNIGNLFTLAYTGSEEYAAYSITVDPISLKPYFITYVGKDKDHAGEDIRIELNPDTLKSINALVQTLETYENYAVSVHAKYNQRIKVNELDTVERKSIKIVPGGLATRVTAVYADLTYTLNVNSQFVKVTALNREFGEIENMPYTSLEGGTEGTSPSSWIKYFDMLSDFDTYYIVPLTSDNAIHAELAAHIDQMSGNLGHERRGIIGGANYETVAETLQRAMDVRSARMQVVHGGFYDYSASGDLTLYPPYILAAQHAGRAAFLPDGEAATHNVYNMVQPETKLEDSEITQLLDGGCLAFQFVLGRNGNQQSFVRLVHDLTTDVLSEDTVHTERATGALADSINMEMRSKLDSLFTGKRIAGRDMESAKIAVISILQRRQLAGDILAFKDVFLTKVGTVTEVHYSVAPAEPNNFTLITGHYYSETLSA